MNLSVARLRLPRRLLILSTIAVATLGATMAMGRGLGVTLLNAVSPRHGAVLERDIAYGALPRQKLDLYTPPGANDRTPVIVFFYGGGWHDGAKDIYRFVGWALAAAGYVVAIPDYRVYPDVVFPAFAEDAAHAVAFVAKRLGAGEGKRPLVVAGHSAGAHIALLLSTDRRYLADAGVPPTTVRAVVGLSGPYDFLPLTDAIYKAIFPEAIREDSQPINFVRGGEPPALLVAGDADQTVKPGNTTRLAKKFADAGGVAEVKIYPGVSHVGTVAALAEVNPLRNRQVLADMVAFLDARLKP